MPRVWYTSDMNTTATKTFRLLLQMDPIVDGWPEEEYCDEIEIAAPAKDADAIFEEIQAAVALVLKCHGVKA